MADFAQEDDSYLSGLASAKNASHTDTRNSVTASQPLLPSESQKQKEIQQDTGIVSTIANEYNFGTDSTKNGLTRIGQLTGLSAFSKGAKAIAKYREAAKAAGAATNDKTGEFRKLLTDTAKKYVPDAVKPLVDVPDIKAYQQKLKAGYGPQFARDHAGKIAEGLVGPDAAEKIGLLRKAADDDLSHDDLKNIARKEIIKRTGLMLPEDYAHLSTEAKAQLSEKLAQNPKAQDLHDRLQSAHANLNAAQSKIDALSSADFNVHDALNDVNTQRLLKRATGFEKANYGADVLQEAHDYMHGKITSPEAINSVATRIADKFTPTNNHEAANDPGYGDLRQYNINQATAQLSSGNFIGAHPGEAHVQEQSALRQKILENGSDRVKQELQRSDQRLIGKNVLTSHDAEAISERFDPTREAGAPIRSLTNARETNQTDAERYLRATGLYNNDAVRPVVKAMSPRFDKEGLESTGNNIGELKTKAAGYVLAKAGVPEELHSAAAKLIGADDTPLNGVDAVKLAAHAGAQYDGVSNTILTHLSKVQDLIGQQDQDVRGGFAEAAKQSDQLLGNISKKIVDAHIEKNVSDPRDAAYAKNVVHSLADGHVAQAMSHTADYVTSHPKLANNVVMKAGLTALKSHAALLEHTQGEGNLTKNLKNFVKTAYNKTVEHGIPIAKQVIGNAAAQVLGHDDYNDLRDTLHTIKTGKRPEPNATASEPEAPSRLGSHRGIHRVPLYDPPTDASNDENLRQTVRSLIPPEAATDPIDTASTHHPLEPTEDTPTTETTTATPIHAHDFDTDFPTLTNKMNMAQSPEELDRATKEGLNVTPPASRSLIPPDLPPPPYIDEEETENRKKAFAKFVAQPTESSSSKVAEPQELQEKNSLISNERVHQPERGLLGDEFQDEEEEAEPPKLLSRVVGGVPHALNQQRAAIVSNGHVNQPHPDLLDDEFRDEEPNIEVAKHVKTTAGGSIKRPKLSIAENLPTFMKSTLKEGELPELAKTRLASDKKMPGEEKNDYTKEQRDADLDTSGQDYTEELNNTGGFETATGQGQNASDRNAEGGGSSSSANIEHTRASEGNDNIRGTPQYQYANSSNGGTANNIGNDVNNIGQAATQVKQSIPTEDPLVQPKPVVAATTTPTNPTPAAPAPPQPGGAAKSTVTGISSAAGGETKDVVQTGKAVTAVGDVGDSVKDVSKAAKVGQAVGQISTGTEDLATSEFDPVNFFIGAASLASGIESAVSANSSNPAPPPPPPVDISGAAEPTDPDQPVPEDNVAGLAGGETTALEGV